MQPTGSDLHIDTFLSNLSIAYMNEPSSYIAADVFPIIDVKKQSDKYAIYEKYAWFRDEAQKRAPLTESAGGHFGMETPGTFYCDEYAFHKDYADEDVDNEDDVFDLDDDSTQYVTEKLRLSREKRWADTYFGEGIWGTDLSGHTDAPSTNEFYVWDDYANSTPISDIFGAKVLIRKSTGLLPNTLVVSERVHMALCNNPDILERYKYTQTGIITEQLLAKVFEMDRYLVARAIYTTTKEGASTQTTAYIANEYGALLAYVNPRPSKRRPSAGYIFRWARPTWSGQFGDRLESTIRKYYMELIHGTRIEGSSFEDIKLIASDCGIYFKNAIAAGRTVTS